MNVFDLEGSISLDISGYKKSLSDAKKQTEDAAKTIKDQAKKIEDLKTEIESLKNELEENKKETEKLKKEYDDSKKSAEAYKNETKKTKEAIDSATESTKKAKKATEENADANKKASKETDENKKSTDKYGDSADKTADKAKHLKNETYDLGETANKVSGKITGLATVIGSMLVDAAKVSVAAIGTVSTAIAALTGKAVSNYGEYEQLKGGAEKIFEGMDFNRIQQDASKAYRELNMSASEYYGAINLAGASFTQTMGSEKAYETARKGMLAISDFASGTGKSIDELNTKYQMITRSTAVYQSIADQFSGILPQTSSDFLEQAQAAGYLSDQYKKLTEVPVAEYQEAVTNMIEKGVEAQNLSNNTLRESTKTLTGSIAMTKKSWDNLVTGLADPDADLSTLINEFTESAEASLINIVPTVQRALSGIGTLVKDFAPIIKAKLPKLLKEITPPIVKAATQLVGALGLAIIDLLPELGQTIFDNVTLIWEKLSNLGSKLMDNVIKPAWDWVTKELPSYINEGLNKIDFFAIGKTMSDAIKSGLIGIADFVSEIDWKKVGTDLAEFINGIDFKAIVKAFLNGVVAIIKATPDLISGFLGSLDFDNFAIAVSLLLVPKLLASLASQLAVSQGWQSIQNVVNEKVSGADGAGGIGYSMGFKLMAAFESFLIGWEIGSWVYNHFEEQINGVLFPIFDKIKEAWDNLFSDEEDSLKSYAKKAISLPKEAAKGLGDKVRGWLNVTTSKFHATGGVLINQPIMTNHGDVFGEDGREVILPLDRNTGWMNELAQRLGRSGGVVVENLTISMDGMKIASDYDTDRFIERISERLEELRISQSRSLGGIG